MKNLKISKERWLLTICVLFFTLMFTKMTFADGEGNAEHYRL